MSYSWYRKGTCTVNASNMVRFQNADITTAPNKPVVGDAFIVNGGKLREIVFIGSDSTGEFIRLNKAYDETPQYNIDYAIARFASGTQNAKLVAMASAAINQKQISLDDLYEWYTSTADTVVFHSPDGTEITLTTYHKLTNELSTVGSNTGDIVKVANAIDDVKSLASDMPSVKAVAPSIPAIDNVNANIAPVKSVSDNMATILGVNAKAAKVDQQAAEVNTKASEAAQSAAEAKASADSVDTVVIHGMKEVQFEANRAENIANRQASGFDAMGKHRDTGGAFEAINQGLYTNTGSPNQLILGRATSTGTASGLSDSDFPITCIAGVVSKILGVSNATGLYGAVVKFPQAEDGTRTYDSASGAPVVHADSATAFAAETATNKVVTDRMDMWGFEHWPEEVTVSNPYVYPYGLIQSLSNAMEGISTSASSRPVTYYAWFGGDTTSKGKGVNFFAASDANQKKLLSNPRHKLFYGDDGKLYQWRLRGRSFAGVGNGDWGNLGSIGAGLLQFNSNSLVRPQGNLNDVGVVSIYRATAVPNNANPQTGVFSTSGHDNIGVNGECYFLVCGTVSRLNKGAYHPSFNPLGATTFWGVTAGTKALWSSDIVHVVSSTECFGDTAPTAPDAAGKSTGGSWTGFIDTAFSGRPDGRYYDAVYAEGQGGVCRDMRYKAERLTSVDFAEADLKAKNGTLRGFEKREFTRVTQATTNAGSWDNLPGVPVNIRDTIKVGDRLYVQTQSGEYTLRTVTGTAGGYIQIDAAVAYAANYLLVISQETTTSVGGNFLQTDVIGDPAKILLTPALVQGWEGSWIHQIPNGTSQVFSLSRKSLGSPIDVTLTNNNGTSWASAKLIIDEVTNSWTGVLQPGYVRVFQYQAAAKITEPADNAPPLAGVDGVGRMYVNSGYLSPDWGALLGESLFDNIGVSVSTSNINQHLSMTAIQLLPTTFELDNNSNRASEHTPLLPISPSNGSKSFKALNYNVEESGQGFINYAATELQYDGSDWGDDSRIHIVDGESTTIDLNGNTVKVATHRLVEPLGWA